MPLSCDCYGGCWGDHSQQWPRVAGTPTPVEQTKHQTVSAEAMAYYRLAQKVLPYGTYVFMSDHLRVETNELMRTLLNAMGTVGHS